MIEVLCFAAIALLGVFPVSLFLLHQGVALSLLIAFAAFLLLHLLYFSFFRLAAGTVPTDRPLEKQNAICRFGAPSIIAIVNFYAGVRPVITGLEKLPKDGRFLYVCNHRSGFDPLVVIDKLRDYNISFISKPSNLKIPIAGRIAYAIGFLPIDRENDRNALKTILTAADYLKRDLCSIGVYPEGTRSRTGDMLPFHAGCFKTAQKAKVPIAVASVYGSENVRHIKLFSGTPVHLNILEVIPAETVCSMRTDALSDYIQALIQADLDRNEAKAG